MGLTIVPRREAPRYSKVDYPYIERGFIAANYPRATDALATFVSLNNETTNVWSQTIGWLVFFAAIVTMIFFKTPPQGAAAAAAGDGSRASGPLDAEYYHHCVTACLVGDLIVCSFSLACHLFQARTARWHTVLSVFDWGGTAITAVITCAIMDFNAELTHSAAWFQGLPHFLFVVVSFGVLLLLFTFGKTTHAFRFYSIFILGVLVGLPEIPMLFSCSSWWRAVVGLLGFFVGGTFFSTHLPERAYRRTFDLCCSSHTLWHVGYLVGLYQVHACLAVVYTGTVPWEDYWMESISSSSS